MFCKPKSIKLYLSVCFALCCTPFARTLAQESEAKEDKPFAVFSGMIMGSDGKPVDDAVITLSGKSYHRAETDDFGVFAFLDTIESGDFKVRIESSKYLGITDFRNLPSVSFKRDDPAVQNFTLKKAAQIKLTVVDSKGNPVACRAYYSPLSGARYSRSQDTKTNADGVAILGGLDPKQGKYQVGIQSPKHAIARLVVPVGDVDTIEEHKVELEEGETVTVRVICSDGEPAAGWRLSALPAWWNFNTYPMSPVIDDNGVVKLEHVGAEKYNLMVSIPEGRGMSTSRPLVNATDLQGQEEPITLKFDYPSPKSMRYLEGTIRWVGKPMDRGLRISGYSSETQKHFSHHLEAGEKEFRIGPVPQGNYRIRVESGELEVMNLRKVKGLDDLSNVAIPNTEKLQIVLRHIGKPVVEASVVDAATQKPINDFRFLIRKLRTNRGPNYVPSGDWVSGEDGKLNHEVVGPGVYQVLVLSDGYALALSEAIDTDAPSEVPPQIKLERGVTYSGSITNSKGEPVDGAKVRVLSLSESPRQDRRGSFTQDTRAVFSKAGVFRFENLRPGIDTLRVDHPDYPFSIVRNVTIGKDAETPKIVLADGATLQGTVYDDKGQPVANETLNFTSDYNYSGFGGDDSSLFGTAITDEDGRYSIGKIPAGDVHILRADFWERPGVTKQRILVVDGKMQQVDFGGTARISGRITSGGMPYSNKRLQLTGDDPIFDGMKFYTQTDQDGNFTLTGAPRGSWRLYRLLKSQRNDWAPILDLDVGGNEMNLGEIDVPTGSLTINCKLRTGKGLPRGTRMVLVESAPQHFFGRDVAKLLPRKADADPFVFEDCSPGQFDLACTYEGFTFTRTISITADDIGSQIDWILPNGNASIAMEVLDGDGEPWSSALMLMNEDRSMRSYLSPTDPNEKGVYRLSGLAKGKYGLVIGNLRGLPFATELQATDDPSGQMQKIVLSAPDASATGGLSVLVVDEDGVCLNSNLAVDGLSVRRNLSAHYLVGPVGEYEITLKQPGFKEYSGKLKIESGMQTSTHVIRLKAE